jgi:hypothetical protein
LAPSLGRWFRSRHSNRAGNAMSEMRGLILVLILIAVAAIASAIDSRTRKSKGDS